MPKKNYPLKKNLFALVMAGGRGERFWPISRNHTPKPFISFMGGPSLIERTIERIKKIISPENIFVATNKNYVNLLKKSIPSFPSSNIVAEPCSRDTAPCITLVAAKIARRSINNDATMVILPADHIIENTNAFALAIRESAKIANLSDKIVTIGIKPSFPCTAYGYIKCGDNVFQENSSILFRKGLSFTEKPNIKRAKLFLKNQNYLWNSGIFLWSIKSFATLLSKHNPQLFKFFEDFKRKSEQNYINKHFQNMEKISIDYALMEKLDEFIVAEANFGWDDIGSWESVAKYFRTDKNRNHLKGNKIVGLHSKNNILANYSKDHLIALLDVDNMILIHTSDATLLCPKNSAQKLKNLIKEISLEQKFHKFL